jgi:hypothetical protein
MNFELSISLNVSMWAHSSWPWACPQPLPVPAVLFCTLDFFLSPEFWAINQLDCEHLSSQFMAMGLLTAIAGTGSGFFLIKLWFFTWILRFQSTWMWACELIAHGRGLAHSHYPYRQWFFPCKFFSFHLNSELLISLFVSMWAHSSWP